MTVFSYVFYSIGHFGIFLYKFREPVKYESGHQIKLI